jgi:hypothetical protein
MKTKSGIILSFGALALGFTAWQVASSARASVAVDGLQLGQALTILAPAAEDAAEHAYVGSTSCRKCHIKQFRSWSSSAHGKAFDILKPGERADVKKAHNLDPNKDYTTEANCVKCHVTGMGKEGGYAMDADDKHKQNFINVGCESCHGPGAEYNKLHEEIMKSKRKYTVDEMHAAGMAKVDVNTCTQCHNDQSPTFDSSKPFDFDEKVKEGVHDRVELKQRAD